MAFYITTLRLSNLHCGHGH